MLIEPITGIYRKDNIIPEKEFQFYSIFSTKQLLEKYFKDYGYHFIGFYEMDENLIVVKNNNPELSSLLENFDMYQVIDYRTGNIVVGDLSASLAFDVKSKQEKIQLFSFTHTIEEENGEAHLVEKATGNTILEADNISFITPDLLLVVNCGLEAIFSLQNKRIYPLMNQSSNIYHGENPEEFLDMRNCMYAVFQNAIHPIFCDSVSLRDLVQQFPYGEKNKNKFKLIDSPICYGIFYENNNTSLTRWYNTEDERDSVLKKLGVTVEAVFKEEYQKVKKD